MINTLPDLAVDVFLDGEMVANNLAFREATPYLEIRASREHIARGLSLNLLILTAFLFYNQEFVQAILAFSGFVMALMMMLRFEKLRIDFINRSVFTILQSLRK